MLFDFSSDKLPPPYRVLSTVLIGSPITVFRKPRLSAPGGWRDGGGLSPDGVGMGGL
jgi:hypothetical protein